MSETINEPQLQKTCLHDYHVALGALMSPFGGFIMPIEYSGIVAEHNAVRTACGVFDVSHMGEIEIEGEDASAFVNYIFTNDVTAAAPGQCLYGMMLNEQGGVVDDLLVYKYSDTRYLLVVNASNIEKDERWILERADDPMPGADEKYFDITISLMSLDVSELAVQGPKAEAVLEALGFNVSDLSFYTFKETQWLGQPVVVSRTGYTGEDGFEVYADHAVIKTLFQTLVEGGDCIPCGLGCRDTLRFEVGLPLYGDELTDEISPIEAGLGIFVKLDKPHFYGREAVAKQKQEGPRRKLVGLELEGKAIARHGYEVLNEADEVVGHVTTGYRAISVDRSVALALVDARYAALDTPLKVKIRKKVFPCKVVPKKFFKKSYKK